MVISFIFTALSQAAWWKTCGYRHDNHGIQKLSQIHFDTTQRGGPICLFLQRPTVIITIVWMSLQFKRSWLRSPRISQSSCNPDNRNTILFRAAIPFQLNIVVSTLQVSVAWGGKIFGLNAICPNRSRIPNFLQLSHNPMDFKKRDPRLRQDFKILKMALRHG